LTLGFAFAVAHPEFDIDKLRATVEYEAELALSIKSKNS